MGRWMQGGIGKWQRESIVELESYIGMVKWCIMGQHEFNFDQAHACSGKSYRCGAVNRESLPGLQGPSSQFVSDFRPKIEFNWRIWLLLSNSMDSLK